MALVLPYTLITQGFYSGIISGISTITFRMCGVVKSIYSHKNPDVDNFIRKLDIEYRVNIISTILKNYNKTGTIDIKEHICDKTVIFTVFDKPLLNVTDPIQLSLMYLSGIIREIHNDLISINNEIAYHHTKWFNSWRALDIKKKVGYVECP